MARLNESAQPAAETIEALKRRFIRQNRELARSNSSQSLRLRSLEGEISRLLDENIRLREQIIKLHGEAEGHACGQSPSGIDSFRTKLEAKLKEVGELVQGLGQVQQAGRDRKQEENIAGNASSRISPNQRLWNSTRTTNELSGDDDGRLPSIPEDRQYPRRSLDPSESLRLLVDPTNVTDSPDLGSPPVAHFDEGDPIKFDRSSIQTLSMGSAEIPASLPVHLETRKRRRESFSRGGGLHVESSQAVDQIASQERTADSGRPLKTGAKRKMSVRDDHSETVGEISSAQSRTSPGKPGFSMPPKSPSKLEVMIRQGHKVGRLTASGPKSDPGQSGSKDPSIGRRALMSKSVNLDPLSPVKGRRLPIHEKFSDSNDDASKIMKNQSRHRERTGALPRESTIKPNSNARKVKPSPVETVHEPETPALLTDDLLSPQFSEPSVARPEGRSGTPPPGELGVDSGTGSFGRSSRRSRGAVSYVQPNLRDKMRRPGKELVDAVGAEERARQARATADAEEQSLASVSIKQKSDTGSSSEWRQGPCVDSHGQEQRSRDEPKSPLGERSTNIEPANRGAAFVKARKRTSISTKDVNNEIWAKSTMSTDRGAVQLVSLSNDTVRESKDTAEVELSERPSIFDFSGSPDVVRKTDEEEEAIKSKRSSRRHSSVPAISEHGKGSLSISRRPDRQRESSAGSRLKDVDALIDAGKPAPEVIESKKKVPALDKGERIASRRRSMML